MLLVCTLYQRYVNERFDLSAFHLTLKVLQVEEWTILTFFSAFHAGVQAEFSFEFWSFWDNTIEVMTGPLVTTASSFPTVFVPPLLYTLLPNGCHWRI